MGIIKAFTLKLCDSVKTASLEAVQSIETRRWTIAVKPTELEDEVATLILDTFSDEAPLELCPGKDAWNVKGLLPAGEKTTISLWRRRAQR